MIEHRFKKKFGQNFIKDNTIINKIVDNANVDNDTLVIEIGPGSGALTRVLCTKANNVLAYEIDTELKEILNELKEENTNLEVIFDDFLKRNVEEDIKKYQYKKLYVVANLPYYITTPIITKFIEDNIRLDKMVIMVQKEVADRLTAKASSKEYGSLTVFLNYHFNIKKLFDVSRNVFVPRPNVDSSIVELQNKDNKLYVKDIQKFYKLVKDSFRFKRKTLKNNLDGYDLDKVLMVLKKYDKDLTIRAETLSLEMFVDISNNL